MYDPQGSISVLTSTNFHMIVVVHLRIKGSYIAFTPAIEVTRAIVASI